MESDDDDPLLPVNGDRLFVPSSWAYDAHMVSDPRERFYRLPMGYKRAGDILIDQANANVIDRKNIIYSAIFCYRQAVELFLKSLIDEFGGGKVYAPKQTHDLNRLWERFMCIANERRATDLEGLAAAQRLVSEFQNADERSDGFRFPTDYKNAPFEFGDKSIDMDNLRRVMQALANFFECVDLTFQHAANESHG